MSPAALTVHASEPLPFGEAVLGRHVDEPAKGPIEGDLVISGWVLCRELPRPRVLAVLDGGPPLHVRADRERADIEAAFPEVPHAARSGFKLRIPAALAEQIADDVAIEVELGDGRRAPLWRLSLSPAHEAPAMRQPPPRRRWSWRRGTPPTTADGAAQPARLAGALADPFRVIALISTFNEADIIGPVLEHLAAGEVWSYLIDNDSTDETVRVAQAWLGRGLLGIERLSNPPSGRTSWKSLLARKVELARELGADWYIHHDADEIRESPWPGVTLREAIRRVDLLGYDAIDFRVLNFAPVDDDFRAGDDPRRHFVRWEEPAEYDRVQRKCWKAGAADLALADGGHDVRFAGRRLFPMRFLLRHYPIRSQAHGRLKVFEHRKDRFAQDELALGWHRQYDHVAEPDHLFLRNPASLRSFDLDRIRVETMLQDGRASEEPARERPRPGRGVLEHVSAERISGWAAAPADGYRPPQVDLWDGGRLIATVSASEPRPDLRREGIAAGGGFALATPRELLDGRPHWIWASIADGGVALARSPLVLHAPGRLSLAPRREADAGHRSLDGGGPSDAPQPAVAGPADLDEQRGEAVLAADASAAERTA